MSLLAAPAPDRCPSGVPFEPAPPADQRTESAVPTGRTGGVIDCRRARCGAACVDPAVAPLGLRRTAVAQLAVAALAAVVLLAGAAMVRVAASWSVRRGCWMQGRAAGWLLRALRVSVRVHGQPRAGAALVVGNHVSFLDVLALSAQQPLRQVAKEEVGGWPLVGALARSSGSIFLRRQRWSELPGVIDEMTAALRSGAKVQFFPEATTRCGGALDPFHRSLFQAAIDAAVGVAPVTVRYRDATGTPCAAPAFVGDETILTALRRVLAMRGLTVELRWLPVIPAIAGTGHRAIDRARLAAKVQRAVAADLGLPVLAGRGSSVSHPEGQPTGAGREVGPAAARNENAGNEAARAAVGNDRATAGCDAPLATVQSGVIPGPRTPGEPVLPQGRPAAVVAA